MSDKSTEYQDKAVIQMALQQELKRLEGEAKKQGKTLEQLLVEGALDNKTISIAGHEISLGNVERL